MMESRLGVAAAAEKIREERRLARKQFKIDRAQAMIVGTSENVEMEFGEDVGVGGKSGSDVNTPVDVSSLTPQTFLVRPTRPDANRNRGRKAFKRRPVQTQGSTQGQGSSISTAAGVGVSVHDAAEDQDGEVGTEVDVEDIDESIVEEMEYLQLGLEEAWFLSSALGVLRVFDPATVRLSSPHPISNPLTLAKDTYPPIPSILPLFLTPPSTSIAPGLPALTPLYPDDPFLISYVCYHQFRSLGWVVKPGIKFCCDWLLYRRGPVFSHSA